MVNTVELPFKMLVYLIKRAVGGMNCLDRRSFLSKLMRSDSRVSFLSNDKEEISAITSRCGPPKCGSTYWRSCTSNANPSLSDMFVEISLFQNCGTRRRYDIWLGDANATEEKVLELDSIGEYLFSTASM